MPFVGNFAILHLGRPQQAAAEFARVIVPGGRLALTAWDTPDRARFLGVLVGAFAEPGATLPEDLPSGPDFFRFASDEEFDALFGDQGLDDRRVQTIEFTLSVPSAGDPGTVCSAGRCGCPRSSLVNRRRHNGGFERRSTGGWRSFARETGSVAAGFGEARIRQEALATGSPHKRKAGAGPRPFRINTCSARGRG